MSQQPKAEKAWCVVAPHGELMVQCLSRHSQRHAFDTVSAFLLKSGTQMESEGYRCIRVTITPDTGDEG
jgi:hypothetical protein